MVEVTEVACFGDESGTISALVPSSAQPHSGYLANKFDKIEDFG